MKLFDKLKDLITAKPLEGNRTFIVAAALLGMAAFHFYQGHVDKAGESLLAALAALGIRAAIPAKPETVSNVSTIRSKITAWIAAAIAAAATFFGLGQFTPPTAPAPTPPTAPAPTPPTAPPTAPAPAPKPEPKPDVWKALSKIQFGNAGCTATIVGPRRADGRWDILTAEHCVRGQPREGIAHTRDGREFRIRVVATDSKSDVCWAVTESKDLDDLPFAYLADELPAVGAKIFHGGYGVHVPGNREEGRVVTPDNGAGQTQFELSVSSGDSGGGICTTEDGKVLSTVCCTTNRGGMGQVWGGHVNAIKRLRTQVNDSFPLWTPIETPLVTIDPSKVVIPQQMPSK